VDRYQKIQHARTKADIEAKDALQIDGSTCRHFLSLPRRAALEKRRSRYRLTTIAERRIQRGPIKGHTMENDTDITRSEELNDRETEKIASVLEGARPSNRIDVDRKELRDHLNHMLTKAGLIHSPEGDDEDPSFEEAFAEYASEPESARELRDQYRDLPDDDANNALAEVKKRLTGAGWDLSANRTKILMLTHRALGKQQGYSKGAPTNQRGANL
jgi:hypothetical protein